MLDLFIHGLLHVLQKRVRILLSRLQRRLHFFIHFVADLLALVRRVAALEVLLRRRRARVRPLELPLRFRF